MPLLLAAAHAVCSYCANQVQGEGDCGSRGPLLGVTSSCGVTTCCPQQGEVTEGLLTQMLQEVDRAHYAAQAGGGDQVKHYLQLSEQPGELVE